MTYEGSYVHLVLAGRTADGSDFCLSAGCHRDYPYPAAGFSAVMVVLGDVRLHRSGPELHGLSMPELVPGGERELAMALELHPGLPHGSRSLELVEASLPLRQGFPAMVKLGCRSVMGGMAFGLPGMTYATLVLDASPAVRPWIRVEGREIALDAGSLMGQLEWGELTNFSCRDFHFGYTYRTAIGRPVGDAAGLDLIIDFRAHSLHADGWISRTVDLFADATGGARLTGLRTRSRPAPAPETKDPTEPLPLARLERLVVSPVAVGPAIIDRALCRFEMPGGRRLLGLEESFRPV